MVLEKKIFEKYQENFNDTTVSLIKKGRCPLFEQNCIPFSSNVVCKVWTTADNRQTLIRKAHSSIGLKKGSKKCVVSLKSITVITCSSE